MEKFQDTSTELVLKVPAASVGSELTPGVDITAFKGDLMIIASSLNTAGTDPTLDVIIQVANDADVVISETYSGTGTGVLTEVEGGPDSVAEDITIHMDSATGFTVSGSVTGAIGTGVLGTKFVSPQITFMATAGAVAFVHTDGWTIHTHARDYVTKLEFAQAAVALTGKVERKTLFLDNLGRFLRAGWTLDGTVAPAFNVGIVAYGMTN